MSLRRSAPIAIAIAIAIAISLHASAQAAPPARGPVAVASAAPSGSPPIATRHAIIELIDHEASGTSESRRVDVALSDDGSRTILRSGVGPGALEIKLQLWRALPGAQGPRVAVTFERNGVTAAGPDDVYTTFATEAIVPIGKRVTLARIATLYGGAAELAIALR